MAEGPDENLEAAHRILLVLDAEQTYRYFGTSNRAVAFPRLALAYRERASQGSASERSLTPKARRGSPANRRTPQ